MSGFASTCPRCGASERVSVYVLESIDDRYSHQCTRCGEPSPLRDWQTPPTTSSSTRASPVPGGEGTLDLRTVR